MIDPRLQKFIDRKISEGSGISEIEKALREVEAPQDAFDEAKRYFDSKKKVETRPRAAASESPSTQAPKPSSSVSAGSIDGVQKVDPAQISSIKLEKSSDTPAFLREAQEAQEAVIKPVVEQLQKQPEYNKRMAGSTAIEIIKQINDPKKYEQEPERLDSLLQQYSAFKKDAGELVPQYKEELFPELEKDAGLFYDTKLKEVLKKDERGGFGKSLRSQTYGGMLMAYDMAREIFYKDLLKIGFIPESEYRESLKEDVRGFSSEASSSAMAFRLNQGYTPEQIEKGSLYMAFVEGDFGLLGIDLYSQIPNLLIGAIPYIGPYAVAASAAGGTYASVIDDEDFTEREKLAYGFGMFTVEFITEKIFQTDVASVRKLFGSNAEIPKSVIGDTMFPWMSKAFGESFAGKVIKGSAENFIEEAIVSSTDQVLRAFLAGKEVDAMSIVEEAFIGGAMGSSVSVVTNSPSALLNLANSGTKIKITNKISEINELLKDESISGPEKDVLRERLMEYKSNLRSIRKDAEAFYEKMEEPDRMETMRLNQSIDKGLKLYKDTRIKDVKEGALKMVKDAVDAKAAIEAKYAPAPQAAPKRKKPRIRKEETPEQFEARKQAETSVSKAGFRLKNVKVNRDNVGQVVDTLKEMLDSMEESIFTTYKTTKDAAKRGVESVKNVVNALQGANPDVEVVIHATEQSFKDATGKPLTRGMWVAEEGSSPKVHLYAPAMVDTTGYHEAMHEIIPKAFGKKGVESVYRSFVKAMKSDSELSVKIDKFLSKYKDLDVDGVYDEFVTELSAMISTGDIDVTVQKGILQKFVEAMGTVLGKMGVDVKPTSIQMVDALAYMAESLGSGTVTDDSVVSKKLGTEARRTDRDKEPTGEAKRKQQQKAQKFLDDMDVAFPYDSPLGGYAATDAEGNLLGRIKMSYVNENTVKINEVVSENRGKGTGKGSAIMRIVTKVADKNGTTLTLTATPIDNMKTKGFDTSEKLMDFYGKFGFTRDPKKATMTRLPKQQQIVKTNKVNVDFAPEGNYLNVGMLSGTTNNPISSKRITDALPADVKVEESFVREAQESKLDGQDVQEPTMVIKISRPLTEAEMQSMLDETEQIAIPALYEKVGQVFGSERWGDFDPEFFAMTDGVNLSELAAPTVKKAQEIDKKYSDISEDGSPSTPVVKNPSGLISKAQLIGNSSVEIEVVHTEKNRLKKYEEDGVVSYEKDLSFLNGREVVTLSPDDMLAGEIKINGKTVHEAGGGVFFVLKYRDVWAFSDASTANIVKSQINSMVDRNGATHLLLVKGSDAKLMSSPQGAKSTLLMLETLAEAGLITEQDMAKAFQDAVAKNGGSFSVPENIGSIKRAIESYFEDPTQSTFAARGKVVKDFIVEIGNTESGVSNAKGIQKFFGSDGLRKPSFSLNAKDTDGTESMINLVARASAEPITNGLNSGDVYAVIPIPSRVETFKSDHPSYPFHLRFEDKNTKPSLVIPSERSAGRGAMKSLGGEGYKNLLKSFDGSVLGLASKGWGRGVVDVPTKKTVSKAQPISSDTSSNYANLTEDGKGNFVFYHFSDQNFDAPDPNRAGANRANVTSREERAALSTAGPVTMFYTDINNREGLISSDFGYEVRVPMERVYDLDSDPLNLEEKARAAFKKENPDLAFSASHRAFAMTQVAAEEGFDMTVGRWTKGLSRAHAAKKLPVSDRMVSTGKGKKDFNETFQSNPEKGWVGVSPSQAMGDVMSVYDKISDERNGQGNYDDLYRMYYEHGNYSQAEITELINSSDISAELKAEYKKALAAVPEGYKSQRVTKKAQGGDLSDTQKVSLLQQSTYDPASGKYTPPMTEKQYVAMMARVMKPEAARAIYRSVVNGQAMQTSQLLDGVYENYKKFQKDQQSRAKLTWDKVVGALTNSQVDLKKLLLKHGMNNAYNLLVNRAGAGSTAKFFFSQYEKDVYRGLKKSEIETLDKVILAMRVIQIDTNADNRGTKRPQHPRGANGALFNKETAQIDLERLKNQVGAETFAKIQERANIYFSAFRSLLGRARDAGLISTKTYDDFVQFNYQPRYFMEHVFDYDGDTQAAVGMGVGKDLIQAIKDGKDTPVIMDSRYVLAVYTNSLQNRIARNAVNREMAAAATIPFNNDWIKPLTASGTTFGFQEVSYFEDGKKQQYQLRSDLKNQLDNVSKLSSISPSVKRWVSIATGSAPLKLMATATNALFVATNIPRDFQHILMFTNTYDNMPLPVAMFNLAIDGIKGAAIKIGSDLGITDGDVYRDWIEHGGGMEFLSVQGQANLTSKIGKTVNQTLAYLGETSEVAFRIAVYNRILTQAKADFKKKNGKDAVDEDLTELKVGAVTAAREIIDFSQGGTLVKNLELIAPYINAAFQGFRVSSNYVAKNPAKFAAKVGQVALGIAGLALYNMSMGGDEMEDIPEYIKSRYFVIMLPTTSVDDKGRTVRDYIKVAKAQQMQAIYTPLENVIYGYTSEMMRGKQMEYYSKGTINSAIDAFTTSYIPVNVTEGLGVFGSMVPTLNAVFTYNSNYDSFRKTMVTRDKGVVEPSMEGITDKSVPFFYKAIGQATAGRKAEDQISPIRLKAAVEKVITSPSSSLTVGIGYTILDAVSSLGASDYKGEYSSIPLRETSDPALKSLSINTMKKFAGKTNPDHKSYNRSEEIDAINMKAGSSRKEVKMIVNEFSKVVKNPESTKKERDMATKELGGLIKNLARSNPAEVEYLRSTLTNAISKKPYDQAFNDIKYAVNDRARAEMILQIYGKLEDRDLAMLIMEMRAATNYSMKPAVVMEYKKITK